MRIFQLRAFDLFCLHIYFILFIQLFANWHAYNCGINMSISLFFIYLIYVIRVVIAQARRVSLSYAQTEQKQRLITRHATVPCSIRVVNILKFVTQGILMGMNIFLIVMLVQYQKKFSPEVCGSRDIIVFFIVINFIICIKSVVNIIMQIQKNKKNNSNNTH